MMIYPKSTVDKLFLKRPLLMKLISQRSRATVIQFHKKKPQNNFLENMRITLLEEYYYLSRQINDSIHAKICFSRKILI